MASLSNSSFSSISLNLFSSNSKFSLKSCLSSYISSSLLFTGLFVTDAFSSFDLIGLFKDWTSEFTNLILYSSLVVLILLELGKLIFGTFD